MPMIRFPGYSPRPQRALAALLTTSCALVLAICTGPASAQTLTNPAQSPSTSDSQFSGNSGLELSDSQNNADNPRTGDGTDQSTQRNGTPYGSSYGTSRSTTSRDNGNGTNNGNSNAPWQPEPRLNLSRRDYKPGEFELYVQKQHDGFNVRRFGANLVADDDVVSATQDPLPAVPGDYIVRPGDEITLTMWGSADADLQLTVDRAGRIAVPHVGAITVAGLHSADLGDAISHRVGQTFRNFKLTATVGHVRAIRVFVSGYVMHPGSVTVNGLSSVLHAIMRAGGPSAAGSFRDIHLRRAGKDVATFDLYDLLLKGDRDTDRLVQPDDVIFIGPVGTQVAMLGSVNQQAIYELKANETLGDALRMAGGFTAVADRSRVSIERLSDRNTGRVSELRLPGHEGDVLATGDVVRAFSVVTATLPQGGQNEHVRIEGEVAHPGDYILPPGSRISDALRAAGGMTAAAYPFGTEFSRESVRKTQQANYERALRDLETDISRNQSSQRATSAEEVNAQAASAQSTQRLVDRLRQVRPTGRVVLQLKEDATTLPDLALEDGDTIDIPPRGSSVGVFGSVFNTGSFVYEPGHTTQQYLALAGGPTVGADKRSIFMLRANGSVISARQGASFWRSGSAFDDAIVGPGDTLFVPEEMNKSTFVQDAKDWTQILYQFGLGLAGIKTLGL